MTRAGTERCGGPEKEAILRLVARSGRWLAMPAPLSGPDESSPLSSHLSETLQPNPPIAPLPKIGVLTRTAKTFDMALNIEKILVVSHVRHYRHDGHLYAYGPYAREIDVWADLFPWVQIAAPLRDEKPPGDCLSFKRANISLAAQFETGGSTPTAKVMQIILLPALLLSVARAMRGADAIHVRCPGNLGLLGVVLAPVFSRYFIAKYAGQWNGYEGERLSVRLQRYLLRSAWWRRGLVLVYGKWPGQPRQVVPFFTSMMSSDQVKLAKTVAASKALGSTLKILYAGRLATVKGIDILLRAVSSVRDQGQSLTLQIVGGGPDRERLIRLTQELNLESVVTFTGAVPYDTIMDYYGKTDVLVLPSRHSEGWPKVLAEGMCHGLVVVGTDHGLIPWLLEGRGYVVPGGDVKALASCLLRIGNDPEGYLRLSAAAAQWAQRYSIDGFGNALRDLLAERWGFGDAR